MRYGSLLYNLFFLALCCLSCTGTASPQIETVSAPADPVNTWNFTGNSYSSPEGLRFIPAPLPAEEAAVGVGTITRVQRDPGAALNPAERAGLSAAFRDAYVGGLFRGQPLDGVLGGDQVHGWPIESPVTWVQNWRGSENYPNSWGIPSLILAVRGLSGGGVFILHGAILDAYGKSGGRGGANGAVGYGAPRGEAYRWGNGIAQRFDFGLILIDGSGKAIFLPEDAPSAKEQISGGTGVLSGSGGAADSDAAGGPDAAPIGEAFRSAWMSALDRDFPARTSDGPVCHLDFSPFPWTLTGDSGGNLVLTGIYYQTFDEGKVLFILGESPSGFLPGSAGGARLLTGSFLNALLTADRPLLGAEALAAEGLPAGFTAQENSALARTLLEGIALYGFPLSDAIPQKDDSGNGWVETQRFSRGWITTAISP